MSYSSNLFNSAISLFNSGTNSRKSSIDLNEINKTSKKEKNCTSHCLHFQKLLDQYEMQKFDESMYIGSNLLEQKLEKCLKSDLA
jgi:hypothetical protein